jgi:hypothetical protein
MVIADAITPRAEEKYTAPSGGLGTGSGSS